MLIMFRIKNFASFKDEVIIEQSEKNKKAQLIFTTHDISLMNRRQFRRDEIAFVDKNKRGESSIYTLTDIRARSDASFSKDYLSDCSALHSNGRYRC